MTKLGLLLKDWYFWQANELPVSSGMRQPPAIPAELLNLYGQPEEVFRPNMQFRRLSALLGLILIGMGVAFFVWSYFDARDPNAPQNGSNGIRQLLGGGLIVVGGAAFFLPFAVPRNWVIVCPNGLIRNRGEVWESVTWADIVRFDDATLSARAVTIRQCRIVTRSGPEWGIEANWTADFDRLCSVIRHKLKDAKAESHS